MGLFNLFIQFVLTLFGKVGHLSVFSLFYLGPYNLAFELRCWECLSLSMKGKIKFKRILEGLVFFVCGYYKRSR